MFLKRSEMVVAVQPVQGRGEQLQQIDGYIDNDTVEPQHENDFHGDLKRRFLVLYIRIETPKQGIEADGFENTGGTQQGIDITHIGDLDGAYNHFFVVVRFRHDEFIYE